MNGKKLIIHDFKNEMVCRIKLYRHWKKDHIMNDKKRIKIRLKAYERVYSENPKMRDSIDSVMVGVCAEECVSPKQVFFILLFFAVVFIVMG